MAHQTPQCSATFTPRLPSFFLTVSFVHVCPCVLQSRELLLNLLQLEPSNTRALGMLGSLEWKAGRRPLARKYLTAGIEADPKHVSNLHSLARLELEEGNLQEARQLFAQGQKLEPHNAYILQVAIYLPLPCSPACGPWMSQLF